MSNKKVVYLITKNTKGRGGHYYSLKTTAESLNGVIEPYILTISKVNIKIIEETIVPNSTIYFNGWNIISVIFSIIKIIRKEKPSVIHVFDNQVLSLGRIISFLYKIPLLYTKCGGGNPSGYYPYIKNFILYSHENLNFFKSEAKLKKSNFYFIPNRVGKIKNDKYRIALIKEKIDERKKIFLRIARFGPAYQNSIMQAIELVLFLNNKGINSQLILIGIVQDQAVYNKIIDYIAEKRSISIYIFTEDKFTVNASELIEIADCIIGTGRSLMEASSKNKVLFTPVEDSKLPIMITEENFMDFYNTNFSPRNQLSKTLISKNEENIMLLFKSKKYFISAQIFSKTVFEKYFSIDTKKEEYYKIYSTIVYDKQIYFVDFIENLLYNIISFARGVK